jgi:hypothetical protein
MRTAGRAAIKCRETAKTSGLVQVAVEDAGPGIEEKELSRVFERYRQLDRLNPPCAVARGTPRLVGSDLKLSAASLRVAKVLPPL